MEKTIYDERITPKVPYEEYKPMFKHKGSMHRISHYQVKVLDITFRDAPRCIRSLVTCFIWIKEDVSYYSVLLKEFDDCQSYMDAYLKGSSFAIEHYHAADRF